MGYEKGGDTKTAGTRNGVMEKDGASQLERQKTNVEVLALV